MELNTKYISAVPQVIRFDNDFDTDNRAYVPEVWAAESLMVLEENMVLSKLVHRDFENEIASYGDVVNTRRPGEFEMKRKGANDDITVQAATADKVQVKLNQLLHTSFLLRDEEMSKSFKDLVPEFLAPAVRSIARGVDQILAVQCYQFPATTVGKLGTALTKSTIVGANTAMNKNKVPVGPGVRNMILTPSAEGDLLNVADFTKVNEADDAGEALRYANLGRKFGFDFYMDQNMPSIAAQTAATTGAVNLSAGYAAGTTSMAIDGHSDTLLAGQWFTVAGDMTPQVIVTATGTPTTVITFAPGLRYAVANNAVISVIDSGAVNLSAGYAASYISTLAMDNFTAAPAVGQLISLGSGASRNDYGAILTPTTTAIDLDRELAAAVANDAIIGKGPSGEYSMALHRNAIALVTRPLVTAPPAAGAMQAVASYGGLSVRVSMAYDPYKQGMLITVDMLAGVKLLDANLGCLIYS